MRLITALLFPACLAAAQIPVLIVDGVNNHDWQAGTRGIQEALAKAGGFKVDVATVTATDIPAWHPRFTDYRAVILNWNGGHTDTGLRWTPEVEQSLDQYVRNGGGLVVFHAANNAFLHWDAYNHMIGLGWRPKTFGPSIVISPDEKVVVVPQGEGLNPGHGPRHDFEMTVLDTHHPITKGIPKHFPHPSEQLTHGQHGPAEGLTILTYAWSKDTKENEPMDWVRSWGKGRIYVTMLGHTWKNEENPNLRDPWFQKLLAQGVKWAAGK